MIFIADTKDLYEIADRLTIGGSYYAEAIRRLNNLPDVIVEVGQPLSIPDSWLKNKPGETIELETVDVRAPFDYTIPLLIAMLALFLISVSENGKGKRESL